MTKLEKENLLYLLDALKEENKGYIEELKKSYYEYNNHEENNLRLLYLDYAKHNSINVYSSLLERNTLVISKISLIENLIDGMYSKKYKNTI